MFQVSCDLYVAFKPNLYVFMSHIDITFLGKGYGCPSYSDIPEIPGKILVKEKKRKKSGKL